MKMLESDGLTEEDERVQALLTATIPIEGDDIFNALRFELFLAVCEANLGRRSAAERLRRWLSDWNENSSSLPAR
jgi:hypothetical protein